jgi:hypothetical protein
MSVKAIADQTDAQNNNRRVVQHAVVSNRARLLYCIEKEDWQLNLINATARFSKKKL